MPLNENINLGYKKVKFKGLAIDAYITSKASVERSVADKEFVIGYKKVRNDGSLTNKFATLMILRGHPALVLHICDKKDQLGLHRQKEIDELLGHVYERNEMQVNQKSHEVFIRLDWVKNFEDICFLIDEAYEKRA